MFRDLVIANRSYRRFIESESISRQTLLDLIDLARLSPSGANKQALRYYVSCEPVQNEQVFTALAWAAYFKDWAGPVSGERPTGYIVIVQDQANKMVSGIDYGIAAQTILRGATEMGLGGCMIGNINKPKLEDALDIPENYEILLVIALGKPKETVVIDEIDLHGDIKYWRDAEQIHHVPKRKLKDIVLN